MNIRLVFFGLLILAIAYLAYGWTGVFWTIILTITPIVWILVMTVSMGKSELGKTIAKYPEETKAFIKEMEKKGKTL